MNTDTGILQSFQDALMEATPDARAHVLDAVEKHEAIFLERLLRAAERHGPDGEIVRNDFDLSLLRLVVAALDDPERPS